jgi:hypothetical protein
LHYEERLEDSAQVRLVKHDQVAKSFATDGSDNSLNVDVLSRREWCGRPQTKPVHVTARTAF